MAGTWRLGMHRVDGRSFWFGGYFNRFDRGKMIQYAGQGRADRFLETFGDRLPFAEARIVKVFDEDAAAAGQFAETFEGVSVAGSLEEFAEGLDGVIVPFPSGGSRRDYRVTAPLVERGLPLFLDRIILEQAEVLAEVMAVAERKRAPLLVTCFMRYFAELLLPENVARAEHVTVVAAGEPVGYGADLLDLVDQLMGGRPVSVLNAGSAEADVLRIAYDDGRHAVIQLLRHPKVPMQVMASGEGWCRSQVLDGSQFHRGAMRQFEAFLESLRTRCPAVGYERVRRQAAILRAAEAQRYGQDIAV